MGNWNPKPMRSVAMMNAMIEDRPVAMPGPVAHQPMKDAHRERASGIE